VIKQRDENKITSKENKKDRKITGRRKQENNNILYSAKKIKEKYAPPYSVLNPLTNSDSDSLKSKGARWVSARVQIIQGNIRKRKMGEEDTKNERTEKEETKKMTITIRVLKTDS
jgi:hypothetical protein